MLCLNPTGKGLLSPDVITFLDHLARGLVAITTEQVGGNQLMRRMTLRRLEVFVAVVEAGGFRACSDQLDISPTAVSHQVNQLEAEIGYRLFLRRRGRVCNLTERGAMAYGEAKGLLGQAKSFESLLAGINRKATRRVAVFADPILDSHIAKHITEF